MANTGVIRTLSGGAHGWATRAEYLAGAGSGQLSQTLLRGTSFWLTAIKQSVVDAAAFTFSAKNNKIRVSGFCRSDGEAFEITHLKWDGKILSFTARMPSTDTVPLPFDALGRR